MLKKIGIVGLSFLLCACSMGVQLKKQMFTIELGKDIYANPTLYLKKEVYESVGYFDLNYKIAADYDFMLRMLKNNFKLYYIDDYLVKMRSGGVSTNGLKGYFRNLKEANSVLRKNHISFPVISNITRIIKTIFQGFSAKINAKKILKKL